MTIIHFILAVFCAYLSAYIFYEFVLLASHFLIKERNAEFLPPKTRFAVIVPAHNEELLLQRLLKSISGQRYPAGLFQAIVVADNCTDDTARIASEQGARALERTDEQHRGKGYAIKFALEKIDMKKYDAVCIIDADSIVKDDFLKCLDHALSSGKTIIQCYNGVANADESWFTRLLDVSRAIGNEIYHPAKQKLGLSSYLMGNGMCFSTGILIKYGWTAFTIGEDWEYYAKLIFSGETIAFANKARVYHQESSSLKQATSQRIRWSSGRFAVLYRYGIPLFFKGLKERNLKKIDASLPLIFPNPSLGMNMTLGCLAGSLVTAGAGFRTHLLAWFFLLSLMQVAQFLVGVYYTDDKPKKALSLVAAPLFLIWKMGIDGFSGAGFGRKKWTRTARKQ